MVVPFFGILSPIFRRKSSEVSQERDASIYRAKENGKHGSSMKQIESSSTLNPEDCHDMFNRRTD